MFSVANSWQGCLGQGTVRVMGADTSHQTLNGHTHNRRQRDEAYVQSGQGSKEKAPSTLVIEFLSYSPYL